MTSPDVPAEQARVREALEALARSLATELARSGGKRRKPLVVYATDLECNHLRKNLTEVDIKPVDAG